MITQTCAVTGTAVRWYDGNATERAAHYESLSPMTVHAWLLDLLPISPSIAVDVGAGTGRDAAWLASMGHRVVAVEPSAAMRAEAARRRPGSPVLWLDDRLPSLDATLATGISADLVLLSAVWMHLPPALRAPALERLATLLRPGGLLAITLRHGPEDAARAMHVVSSAELLRLAAPLGLAVERVTAAEDQLGRAEVSWSYVAFRGTHR